MQLDEKDIEILKSLRLNSRKPRKTLAMELAMTESSLSKKIKKMADEGVISRFSIEVSFKKLGFGVSAMTHIKEKGQEETESLAEFAKSLPYSTNVYKVGGDWDVMIIWKCKNNEELDDCITKLYTRGNIERIKTDMLLREIKSGSSQLLDVIGDI